MLSTSFYNRSQV
jgi:hypothetical protein